MARRIAAGERLVVASHNPGKVVEIEALLAPFGVATVGAAALGLPEPEETGDDFEANAALKARAAAAGERAAGAGRRFRAGRAGAGRRAGHLLGALGRAGARISAPRWSGCERELGGQETGSAHFVAVLALAWPDGEIATFRGEVARPAGLAAARRARLRLRPDLRPRRVRHDLRRDRPGREAPHQPPRARLREAGRACF